MILRRPSVRAISRAREVFSVEPGEPSAASASKLHTARGPTRSTRVRDALNAKRAGPAVGACAMEGLGRF